MAVDAAGCLCLFSAAAVRAGSTDTPRLIPVPLHVLEFCSYKVGGGVDIQRIFERIFAVRDTDGSGSIEMEEWTIICRKDLKMPGFMLKDWRWRWCSSTLMPTSPTRSRWTSCVPSWTRTTSSCTRRVYSHR